MGAGAEAVIRHYYHIYADGQWCDAVREHLDALGEVDRGAVDLRVLAVGSVDNCIEALGYTIGHLPDSVERYEARTARDGWEQETLTWLKSDVDADRSSRRPYLYCHTKGAYNTA